MVLKYGSCLGEQTEDRFVADGNTMIFSSTANFDQLAKIHTKSEAGLEADCRFAGNTVSPEAILIS